MHAVLQSWIDMECLRWYGYGICYEIQTAAIWEFSEKLNTESSTHEESLQSTWTQAWRVDKNIKIFEFWRGFVCAYSSNSFRMNFQFFIVLFDTEKQSKNAKKT